MCVINIPLSLERMRNESHINPSGWFFGPKAFVFENPKALPFMSCPGKLSFFDVEYVLPGMSL